MSSSSSYSSSSSGAAGTLVRPFLVPDDARRELRKALKDAEVPCHVPCPLLPSGRQCILKDLGECGDTKCGNYRLGKYAAVRPDFLQFCVEHIKRQLHQRHELVYCSLGSGQLLFDWELLERLTQKEKLRIRAIHLIDTAYGGEKFRKSAARAQCSIAVWELKSWLEQVDILMDCDAVSARKPIDVDLFRQSVLSAGGLCLVPTDVVGEWTGAVEPGQADLHPEVEEEKGQGTTDYSTLKSPPGDLKELVRQIYRNEVWQEPREDAHGSKRRSKRSSEKRSEQRSARSRTRERERHAAKGEENLWQVGVLQEFAVLELLYGTVLVQCSLERWKV
ncbi:Putative RNA-binding protein Luc7-like 1 [Durusdinium trenchii]|uniref:RNA-binding protein Luc7-like 1 n=1 Tax=Durusdinium trenchii TaxID=1381693 RepID=A0ABP0JAS0_9DINO